MVVAVVAQWYRRVPVSVTVVASIPTRGELLFIFMYLGLIQFDLII